MYLNKEEFRLKMKTVKINTLVISAPYGIGVTTLIKNKPVERKNYKILDLRFDRHIHYEDGVGRKTVELNTNDGRIFNCVLELTNHVEYCELVQDLIGSYHIIFIKDDPKVLRLLNEMCIPFIKLYYGMKDGKLFNPHYTIGRIFHHFAVYQQMGELSLYIKYLENIHDNELVTTSYVKPECYKNFVMPTKRATGSYQFISDFIDDIINTWNRFYDQYYKDDNVCKSYIPTYTFWKLNERKNMKYNDDLLDYIKSIFVNDYHFDNVRKHSKGCSITTKSDYMSYLHKATETWQYVGEGDDTFPVYRFIFNGTLYYAMIGCNENRYKLQIHMDPSKLRCSTIINYNNTSEEIPEICL